MKNGHYCRQSVDDIQPTTTEELDSVQWYGTARFDADEETNRRLYEAETVLRHELGESLFFYSDKEFYAMVHARAFELLEREEELIPGMKTTLMAKIFNETIWSDAGYKDVREWFNSETSIKSGGQRSDLIFIAETLIPYCETFNIVPASYFTPKLSDKGVVSSVTSKLRIPGAIPTLREVIEDHGKRQLEIFQSDMSEDAIQEEIEDLNTTTAAVVSNVVKLVVDPTKKRSEIENEIAGIRDRRALVRVHRNGNLTMLPTVITERQWGHLQGQAGPLRFEEVEIPEEEETMLTEWVNQIKSWFIPTI